MYSVIKSSVTVVFHTGLETKYESANKCEEFQEGIYNQTGNEFSGRLCHEYIHLIKHLLNIF